MQRTTTGYRLSTGKTLTANVGAISLGPSNELLEGYDSYMEWDDEPLTQSERREIADYMIARWTAYRAALAEGEDTPPVCDCNGGEQGDGLCALPHEPTCASLKREDTRG